MTIAEHFAPQIPTVLYPESDGNPISDHTLQFEWIVTIKGNLDALFAADPQVFVAGDLLWYPVEGDNKTRVAPDAMVVFGRPKGERGSYRQWDEGGIAPQVVFEVLSPGNRFGEMLSKFLFYQKYGVEEYYLYDPFRQEFDAWLRDPAKGTLEPLAKSVVGEYLSPRLQVRFVPPSEGGELTIYGPNGERFLTFVQLEQARQIAEQARQIAESRLQAVEQERERLRERLRALGIDPETV